MCRTADHLCYELSARPYFRCPRVTEGMGGPEDQGHQALLGSLVCSDISRPPSAPGHAVTGRGWPTGSASHPCGAGRVAQQHSLWLPGWPGSGPVALPCTPPDDLGPLTDMLSPGKLKPSLSAPCFPGIAASCSLAPALPDLPGFLGSATTPHRDPWGLPCCTALNCCYPAARTNSSPRTLIFSLACCPPMAGRVVELLHPQCPRLL
ncbi:hypothetical protein NDU88_012456 [Pleurodeles waltl]|uniref:Uncharacterized protein n=1 Tax=Pleurodeles waltl TaxID=8319 RepID=A0AAV7R1P6_PLEWA|nr:hypothetical protein NDU88_012455 [Pleurodeles waltl]KAJ1146175.1 hypothetical protein NDU88_012456 [Pleurodeles waltl]